MQWIKTFGILTIVCGYFDNGFAMIIDIELFNQSNTSQDQTIPPGYFLFQASYYKYYNKGQTWETAQKICEQDGGYLVIINSEDEASLLKRLMLENPNPIQACCCMDGYIYIGLKKVGDKEGEWITVDGQLLKKSGYDQWAPGEPNKWSNNEYCGTFYRFGGLNDFPCWCSKPFVCEIPLKERTEPQILDWLTDVEDYKDSNTETITETQEDGSPKIPDWSIADRNLRNFFAQTQNEPVKNKYISRSRVLGDIFAKTSVETQEESEKYEYIGGDNDNEGSFSERADSFTETSTEAQEEMEMYEYNSGDLGESFMETTAKAIEEPGKNKYGSGDLGNSFAETFTEAQEQPKNIKLLIPEEKLRCWSITENIIPETSTEHKKEPKKEKYVSMLISKFKSLWNNLFN